MQQNIPTRRTKQIETFHKMCSLQSGIIFLKRLWALFLTKKETRKAAAPVHSCCS